MGQRKVSCEAYTDRGIVGKTGKSAYEQAVEGGYQGTEEEFEQALASDIATVADNVEDINTVAENMEDVNTAADNIQAIIAAPQYAQDAADSASAAATSESNAATSETNAALSANAASVSEQASAASAATAMESATTATAQASAASQSALSASSSATSAQTSATNAQKWAEGTDEQVEDLGGTHSSKGWSDRAQQIAESIGAIYKPAGSIAFASLPALSANVLGNVYNITDAFTTTVDFVEGAGKNYPAGANVAIVDVGTGGSHSYKFDVLSGFVDLSAYRTAAQQDVIDATKQDTLVSGTNIKTVNGNSLLGSGNVDIDALPSQTGQSGKFLTTDGTDASWANVDALPSQTGQSGKFLTTDGSAASWADIPDSVIPDNVTIDLNESDEIQTVGVIDQNTSAANKIWTGTKAEYDAIVTKDPNTTYRTIDEEDDAGGGGGGGADTSLSNLTAAGKEVAATMSMPSSVQDEMSTSGASGSQYTAPADGWFQVATLSGSSDIISLTSPAIASTIRADGSSWSFYNKLQVAKGTVMTIYTQSGNFNAIRRLYFVYAKGSEPQQ